MLTLNEKKKEKELYLRQTPIYLNVCVYRKKMEKKIHQDIINDSLWGV